MPARRCCGWGGTQGKAAPFENCPRAMARICFPEKAHLLHHFRQNFCSYRLAVTEILDNVSPRKIQKGDKPTCPQNICVLYLSQKGEGKWHGCMATIHASLAVVFMITPAFPWGAVTGPCTWWRAWQPKHRGCLACMLGEQPGCAGSALVRPCWQRALLHPSDLARLRWERSGVKKLRLYWGFL